MDRELLMPARPALWPWCALMLVGCNAVLGIDRPSDELIAPSADSVVVGDCALDATIPDTPAPNRDAGVSADGAPPQRAAVPYAWAAWPMPNPADGDLPNHQLYAKDSDGLVTDSVTQLHWQQAVAPQTLSWDEAATYCQKLQVAGGGFRLPTRIELLSLIDFTAVRPTIDQAAFPDTPPDKFWSASPFAGADEHAWLVNFDFGTGFVFAEEVAEKHRVRCVR